MEITVLFLAYVLLVLSFRHCRTSVVVEGSATRWFNEPKNRLFGS